MHKYNKDNKPGQRKILNKIKKNDNNDSLKNEKSHIGTYRGVLDVTSTVFKNLPKISLKKLKREKGSVTVEATISLTIFMFAIVTVLSIINIC